jgi:hypothetical protein
MTVYDVDGMSPFVSGTRKTDAAASSNSILTSELARAPNGAHDETVVLTHLRMSAPRMPTS